MTQKIKKTLLSLSILLMTSLPVLALSPSVFADKPAEGGGSAAASTDPDCNNPSPTPQSLHSCVKHNVIIQDLNVIINILGAVVGVVVTGVIILGGVQYSLAGDSPDGVTKAKKRITSGLMALIAFIFIYAFLQWIVPGGVFSNS